MMDVRFTLAMVLAACVYFAGLSANACPGQKMLRLQDAKKADFVFVGQVEEFRWADFQKNRGEEGAFPKIVRFKVLATLKGEHRPFWELYNFHHRLFHENGKIQDRSAARIDPREGQPTYIKENVVAGAWPDNPEYGSFIARNDPSDRQPEVMSEICSEPFLFSADDVTLEEIKKEIATSQ